MKKLVILVLLFAGRFPPIQLAKANIQPKLKQRTFYLKKVMDVEK
ncbi:hypothetical protein [Peribacillus loiseleuriae]|nr:hypothetical protein [Peribacillus loiseleuriae]